jgi:acyl carrier protein
MASVKQRAGSAAEGPGTSVDELRAEIRAFIVEHLKLPGVSPDSLDCDAPLVGGGLELDSIDILELVTGIEKKYGVRFEDPDLVQKVFASVSSIARHVAAHRAT